MAAAAAAVGVKEERRFNFGRSAASEEKTSK